jgi:putative methylase
MRSHITADMVASQQQLAIFLSKLKTFKDPKSHLEQYSTDSNVAAQVLWEAYMSGDIEGKEIADLGCGTGILGIGALVLGAKYVYFVEIDGDILPALAENLALIDLQQDNYEVITSSVEAFTEKVDTVVQNPPFGTKAKGADIKFLEHAKSVTTTIYSLHKTSTERHLLSWAQKNGFAAKVRRFSYPLKQTMKQHTKRIMNIEVSSLHLSLTAK